MLYALINRRNEGTESQGIFNEQAEIEVCVLALSRPLCSGAKVSRLGSSEVILQSVNIEEQT